MNNFLKLGNTYGTKKSSGRPRKLTPRQERKVIRQLSAGRTSLGKLAQDPNIQVYKSTISRMVAGSKVLSYKKKKRHPRLTTVHKERQVSWAKEHVTWKNQWKQVVFNDEKKIQFRWGRWWSVLLAWFAERRTHIFQMPEGRRLINGGKTNLAFPTGRMKTNDYQDLLDTHLLPFGEAIGGPVWIF